MPTAAPPAPISAKAAPAPTPAPEPKSQVTPAPELDAFGEIDKLAEEPKAAPAPPPKAEPKAPAKPVEPPKAPDKKTEPSAKPTAPIEGDKPEPSADDGRPLTVPELRKNYERVKAENAELKKRVESNGAPKDDPEKTALTSKLTETEKKIGELNSELKYANYEKTEDYQKEFVAPMKAAFESAYADMAQLTIENEDGSERQATPEDFGVLMRMDLKTALAQAKAWFGDAVSEVMAHRRGLIALNQRRQSAIEKFRTEGTEREKTRLADTARQRENIQKAWTQINKDLEAAHPELYQEDEADPEGNKELAEGKTLVQRSLSNEIPFEEAMKARAMVLKNAEAFPRVLQRNKKLTARITELEAELAQFKASEPGAGDGGSRPAGVSDDDPFAEIDRLATQK